MTVHSIERRGARLRHDLAVRCGTPDDVGAQRDDGRAGDQPRAGRPRRRRRGVHVRADGDAPRARRQRLVRPDGDDGLPRDDAVPGCSTPARTSGWRARSPLGRTARSWWSAREAFRRTGVAAVAAEVTSVNATKVGLHHRAPVHHADPDDLDGPQLRQHDRRHHRDRDRRSGRDDGACRPTWSWTRSSTSWVGTAERSVRRGPRRCETTHRCRWVVRGSCDVPVHAGAEGSGGGRNDLARSCLRADLAAS